MFEENWEVSEFCIKGEFHKKFRSNSVGPFLLFLFLLFAFSDSQKALSHTPFIFLPSFILILFHAFSSFSSNYLLQWPQLRSSDPLRLLLLFNHRLHSLLPTNLRSSSSFPYYIPSCLMLQHYNTNTNCSLLSSLTESLNKFIIGCKWLPVIIKF